MLTSYNPNINNKKLNNNKKINLKNFFIFCNLMYSHKKEITFFIKPIKKTTFTILRAPYRYKLAKLQLLIKRYLVTIKLVISTTISKNNFFVKKKSFEGIFNTLLLSTHSTSIILNTTEEKNFFLKKFNVNLLKIIYKKYLKNKNTGVFLYNIKHSLRFLLKNIVITYKNVYTIHNYKDNNMYLPKDICITSSFKTLPNILI